MVSWELSEKVKLAFIQENQNDQSQIFVSHMYSRSLTLSRNQVLKLRHEMKEEDPSIQGYIRYLDTVMIKRSVGNKYKIEMEF